MRDATLPCLVFLFCLSCATAQPGIGNPNVTYIQGSSVKLYQVNGDCDWAVWDATNNTKTPTCKPTTSQTATRADVLGDDVPVSFERNGELIVTFGDTIGTANYYPAWTSIQNSFKWNAHDPIARSTTLHAEDGLLLNFFLNGNHGLEVLPPPQPDGTPVDMSVDDVPHTGVSLNGVIYLGIKTGAVSSGTGNNDQSHNYAVLASFDEATQEFTSGRTISSLPNGHFVGPVFYLAPAGTLGAPAPVQEPAMLIFGLGAFRATNVYLSIIPSAQFWTGTDASGSGATHYFAGVSNGQPIWSFSESSAVPIVTDIDPSNPTIGNVSVIYSQQLRLWLMVYDGGRGDETTKGMYFTYAPQPWGPWSRPQLIYNDCRDKGYGDFVRYYYKTAAENNCPSAMSPGVNTTPNGAGPAGPTIGDQTSNDPNTTRGVAYAPSIVERFTEIKGNTLKLFYMMATWNPYAVVMMESDFAISTGPVISLVANAEGESSTIAPNTWVEIKGSNLAPAGDSRIWQSSDFINNQMPTRLDGVSATVNGKNAFVYYISPAQIDILTPSDPISGPVQVIVSNNGVSSAGFAAEAQSLSPSFFVFNGGPYVAAVHGNGALIGPQGLFPGSTTPAKPGETIALYANGFGPTSVPVASGSTTQSGTLSPLPVVRIGGSPATVTFAGLVGPGEFQFNVVVPATAPDGDQSISAGFGGATTQSATLLTVQH
jgi:uncharacterized protein (TIGR03437 family)